MIEIEPVRQSSPKPLPPADQLHFGRHFTDHWFFARYQEGRGWFESRVEPYGQIVLDPAAAVLHYGQALFEGMKAFRQPDDSLALFRPEFNWNRLVQGAARLCLPTPTRDAFMKGLRELIERDQRWCPREEGTALYIRPTLIGTEPFLGIRPSREALFFIVLSPVGAYYAGGTKPIRIWVEDKALRAAPGGLGDIKAGANYAASLKAGQEAKKRGFDQVLWLDVEHEGIEEVGTMNVFFVFQNEIVTPALNGSILAGNTRDAALELLRDRGLKCVERRITMTELVDRHTRGELMEVFGTGTAAGISPVGEFFFRDRSLLINGRATGALSADLQDTLAGIQRGRLPDRFGWLTPLKKLM